MSGKIKKMLTTVFTVLIAASIYISSFMPVYAEESNNEYGKVINVLYDDSRSMYLFGSKTRWCAAKYALEVFGAMLGENDLMNIYMINSDQIIKVKGNDPNRVSTIHNMNSTYGGTLYKSLERVAKAIKKVENADERWLVVVSDGQFEDANTSQVQSCIDSCTKEGVKSFYLMIGEKPQIQDNPDHYAYTAYTEDSSDSIRQRVTKVANQIFEHQVLPDNMISAGTSKTTLKIDIPVSEIVVFAQGKNAAIGSMEYNGAVLKANEMYTVKYSDVLPDNPADTSIIVVDKNLYGAVAKFTDPSGLFEKGAFSVEVSGASLVEYYYRPAVNVNCELYLGDQRIPADSTGLEAGKYKVKMNFVHPVTGEAISSQLLDDAKFSLTAVNNENEYTIDGTSGEVELRKGSVGIHAVAQLPGNVELKSDKNYKVQQSLRVELAGDPPVYSQEDLVSQDPQSVTIKISDAEDGSPVSTEMASNMKITVFDGSKDSRLVWEWVRSGDNTWTGIPRSADGTMGSVPTGKTDIVITAQCEDGDNTGTGILSVPVTISEYQGSPLFIHLTQPERYDLNNYLRGEYSVIEVTYPDPVTGQEKPLSEEMWNDLSLDKTLTLENGRKPRLNLDLKKGDTPGTYLIRPKCWPFGFTSIFTTANSHKLKLSGTVESGEFIYSGESSDVLDIIPLKWHNIALRIGGLLAVILLIICYIRKPKIKTHGKNFFPHCEAADGVAPYNRSARKGIRKNFLSVISPIGPQRAIVTTGDTLFGCTVGSIRIEAITNNTFKIISKQLPLGHMTINGDFAEDLDDVHSRTLTYSNFSLESLDDNGVVTGTFTFY